MLSEHTAVGVVVSKCFKNGKKLEEVPGKTFGNQLSEKEQE